MNIGIISSREHLSLARVMLSSLCANCSEAINLYLFHMDLKAEEYQILQNNKITVFATQIDTSLFNGIVVKRHFGLYSYFRLLAPYILPENIDRILWLDTDLIICKDLTNYYHSDFDSACLIASPSNMSVNGGGLHKAMMEKYNVDNTYTYFNAGVVLMNLSAMRLKYTLNVILTIAHEDREFLEYIDQDVLNILYWNSCKLSSQYLYNFAPKDARQDAKINKETLKEAFIIHYCGELKPTQSQYRDIGFMQYWKYARKYDFVGYIKVMLGHGVYVLGRQIKKAIEIAVH